MIIEFAGTPRSGKTSCIEALRDYYMREGYQVIVYPESARVCPFPNWHRIETAYWTVNQVLRLVLEASMNHQDRIVLFDRGLFDAIAFLGLLVKEKDELAQPICGDVGTPQYVSAYINVMVRWISCVDLVLLFDVDSDIAIERDIARKIGGKSGLITNRETMKKLRSSYREISHIVKVECGDYLLSIEDIKSKGKPEDTVKHAISFIEQQNSFDKLVRHKDSSDEQFK